MPKGTEEGCSLACLVAGFWKDMLSSIMNTQLKDVTVYSTVNRESMKDFDQGQSVLRYLFNLTVQQGVEGPRVELHGSEEDELEEVM